MYNVPSTSAPHSVIGDEDIQSPAHKAIGSEVLRDNAEIRIPRSQRYLTPTRTNLALVRDQSLPAVPNTPIRSQGNSRQPSQ